MISHEAMHNLPFRVLLVAGGGCIHKISMCPADSFSRASYQPNKETREFIVVSNCLCMRDWRPGVIRVPHMDDNHDLRMALFRKWHFIRSLWKIHPDKAIQTEWHCHTATQDCLLNCTQAHCSGKGRCIRMTFPTVFADDSSPESNNIIVQTSHRKTCY
jgi:hypothetical protein